MGALLGEFFDCFVVAREDRVGERPESLRELAVLDVPDARADHDGAGARMDGNIHFLALFKPNASTTSAGRVTASELPVWTILRLI